MHEQPPSLARAGLLIAAAVAICAALLWAVRPPGLGRAKAIAAAGQELQLRFLGRDLRPLRTGEPLKPDDPLAVTYRNPGVTELKLLVFAIDSAGALHWVVPPEESRPREAWSKALPPSAQEQLVRPPRPLGALPPGPLDLIALVTQAPTAIARIEALAPGDRTLPTLKDLEPDAVLIEHRLVVAAP